MVRRPAFAAAWGLLLSACALDLGGLGAALPGEDAGGGTATQGQEAAAADQSMTEPEGVEAGEVDAGIPDETGSTGETSTSAGDAVAADGDPPDANMACDEDGDGYLAMGGACGGNDCCDQDAHVHPGQKAYFTQTATCGGYDYDCNGKEAPQYGAVSCQWSSFSCNGDGFAAPVPACGAFGTYTSCSVPWYNVLSCTGSDAQQAQGCH